MTDEDDPEVGLVFAVVVNHEEQHSIWPVDRDMPLGWRSVGVTGTKDECLDHIEEVWKDMRPLSLRKRMEDAWVDTLSIPPGDFENAARSVRILD